MIDSGSDESGSDPDGSRQREGHDIRVPHKAVGVLAGA